MRYYIITRIHITIVHCLITITLDITNIRTIIIKTTIINTVIIKPIISSAWGWRGYISFITKAAKGLWVMYGSTYVTGYLALVFVAELDTKRHRIILL